MFLYCQSDFYLSLELIINYVFFNCQSAFYLSLEHIINYVFFIVSLLFISL